MSKENKPTRKVTSNESKLKRATSIDDKPKKNAFSEWFANHKESLEEEFPDLNSFELSKVALKRFREETKPKSSNGPTVKKFFGATSTRQEVQ